MLTIFGTVLPIITRPTIEHESVIELTSLSPMERLACGLDQLGDGDLQDEFRSFLSLYEDFLAKKEQMGAKTALDDTSLDKVIEDSARTFSDFLFKCLTHQNIKHEFVKYLVL